MILIGCKRLCVLLVLCCATAAHANDYDALRLKWCDMLTQGTNADRGHPLYSNWIAEVETTGQSYLQTLDTSAGRTNLFSNYRDLATDSSDITATYERLRAMALAYAVRGSALEGSFNLLYQITNSLDWMTRYYNATSVVYDNWYDFEIAVPRALNDTTVLLYSNLSPAQISEYMSAIDHFSPTPSYTSILSPVTAYNKVWKSLVVSLRGAIVQDSAKVELGRDALSEVFTNVTSGDGFYADGSFIFHDEHPYTTGYGVGLLDTVGSMMLWFQGSNWPITDPAQTNVVRWVFDAYAPFIHRGSAMDMVAGRYPSRNGQSREQGHELLGAMLRIAQTAPPSDAASISAFVKGAIQSDTYLKFVATQFPPFNIWANAILNDSNIVARSEVAEHRQFSSMDRVVHRTLNWTFGLAMSSKRVANYESTRSENLHGWFMGEGMTYLHNADLNHYAENFWATVDPYRLAGTTVDTITRTNGSGNGYNSPNTQVGGASILGRYGVAGMHLNAYGTDTVSARNSWFMFDDEIVCVGNSVSSLFGRQTIVENRRLGVYGNNPFTVNGVAKPTGAGWSETITTTSWAHLTGSAPGADIGYYFPTATTLTALRESRSGRFYDINTTYGSKTFSTGNYLTMYLDHGSNASSATYSYVLLPGMSADEVANYATSPHITVVQNSSKATAVKENRLGITAANFWSDASNYVSGVSSDRKAAVIFRNDGTVLDIGVSDPTQTSAASMKIEFNVSAASILSIDPAIAVLQLAPTIKLLVNTSNKFGATLAAKLLLSTNGQRPTVKLSTLCDKNMDTPAIVTLTADASDPDGSITQLDFYNGTNQFAQVFSPSSANTNVVAPNLPPGSYSFSVVAVDNAGFKATSAPINILISIPRAAGTGTGLVAEYYADQGDFTNMKLTRTDTNVNFDFTSYPMSADHLSVRWTGKLQTRRSGRHCFHTQTDDGVRLWIDGRLLIDHWASHPEVENSASISLAAGRLYSVTMEYYDKNKPAIARLLWTEPGGEKEVIPQSQLYPADQGLRATYYYGISVSAKAFVRVDDAVNFSWGTNTPDPTMLSGAFSARWTGKVKANAAGQYKFFTLSDDAARLYVNGQLVINNWTPHGLTEGSNTTTLATAGGFYDLILEYFNESGSATAVLAWQPPGESKQVIPSINLTPHQNNNPPVLSVATNLVVARGQAVSFASTAIDSDVPAHALTFSLDDGSPPGAMINPTNGLFSWTVVNDQPFGPTQFTLRASDAGIPQMSDAQIVSVTVLTNPSISLVKSPNSLIVKWPASTGAIQLYTTTNLTPPATWLPFPDEPSLIEKERVIEIRDRTNVMQFFRLGP